MISSVLSAVVLAQSVFVQGGVQATALVSDQQETRSGYLHPAFIGELDWPVPGAVAGGGVRVGRHISVGAELSLRRENSTAISEQSHGHVDATTVSSLYTSRERLLSFVVRVHPGAGRAEIQPFGGLTVSRATRMLSDRHGFYQTPGFPPYPVTRPDTSLSETKYGLVGGADVAVRLGSRVAVVAGPRVHWIAREHLDEYAHVVPNAGRLVVAAAAGVQWWPGGR